MSDRERTDAGTFAETVTLDAVVSVFDEVRGPVITSSDVSEALDCSTETARQKLTQLYEEGRVDKRKTGRTTVWWFTGGERITPDERAREEDAEKAREVRDERRGDSAADRSDPTPVATTETVVDASNDPIYELDLPGYGGNLEGRQAAVRAIYEYLKEQGQGQRSDFKEVVNVEATGYAGDTPFNSFWNNCMDSGAVLAQLPGVQSPGEGGHTYTYEP